MTSKNIRSIRPLGFPWETSDPFLFCVHHKDDYPKGNEDMSPQASLAGRNIGQDFTLKDGWRMYHGTRIPGFPYHPHRGFETVTITEKGLIDHADSLGAAGRFGNGDVQWMTAGKGVQHSEMFPMLHQDKGNPLEFFQLWLNLPKANKLVDPHFAMIWADEVPGTIESHGQDGEVELRVVAGRYKELNAPSVAPDSWAAHPENEVIILTAKISPGGKWILPAAPDHVNRTIYFYEGEDITIDGVEVSANHAIQVLPDADLAIVAGSSEAKILLLQGRPIGEPVAQHGPFVMNTQEEIRQAFADYQKTEFGGWPWKKREQVHDRHKGRFALYVDGTEEIK